jgi:3-oxoacyl-[acyl-carrier-protein] synthase II
VSHMRIAITGVGLVTPLSSQREQSWQRLLNGESAGRFLNESEIPSEGIETSQAWYGAPVELQRPNANLTRTSAFALLAARQAISHAAIPKEFLHEMACVIGTSKTDLNSVDRLFHSLKSDPQVSPEVASLFPSQPVTDVAHAIEAEGPVIAPVAACATGLVSIIRAADLLRQGDAVRAIAGSTDSSLHVGLLSSYQRLGVLAKAKDNPATACKPFDEYRCGFIVGEGAGAMVLEVWDEAISRGVRPVAEWVDGMIASDPSGLTSVDSSGETLCELIARLLERNQVFPQQVSAICYHGTATEMNDLTEARAIAKLFPHKPLGFGVKGSIGHLMGAAGSVETAFSALALRDQVIPPTVNHVHHDANCPNAVNGANSIQQPIEYLLKTSLGFGGHIAVGLLKRV